MQDTPCFMHLDTGNFQKPAFTMPSLAPVRVPWNRYFTTGCGFGNL